MPQAHRRPRSFWTAQAEAFHASGLSVRDFCEARDLHAGTFRCWLGRLGLSARKTNDTSPALRLLPVTISEPSTPEAPATERAVVEFEGLRLELPTSVDPEWVGRLFLELRATC